MKVVNPGGSYPCIVKGWNILRQIISAKDYMPKYYEPFESILLPLFEFISDPKKIDFEDDILLAIKTLIRKRKGVTENVWRMVPCFSQVLEKNKHCFGLLMDTVNVLIVTGRDFLATPENKPILHHFVTLACTALFSLEDAAGKSISTRISNNAEGAVLL